VATRCDPRPVELGGMWARAIRQAHADWRMPMTERAGSDSTTRGGLEGFRVAGVLRAPTAGIWLEESFEGPTLI